MRRFVTLRSLSVTFGTFLVALCLYLLIRDQDVSRSSTNRIVAHDNIHKLGIVVPFRKADKELQEFLPHMHNFLTNQNLHFEFYIINQLDDLRFNRGLLLDIGIFEALEDGCDYVALHDVDLLPLNPDLSYDYPQDPFHIAAPWLHPRYHYLKFIGGILIMQIDQLFQVNGLSTNFWGWGKEDDELYKRIIDAGMKIARPKSVKTDSTNTFLHLHDDTERPRDSMKVGEQKKIGKRRDKYTGLGTAKTFYSRLTREKRFQDHVPYNWVDAQLKCDTKTTPWCLRPSTCKPGYYKHALSDGDWMCKYCRKHCPDGTKLVQSCDLHHDNQCVELT